MEQPEDIMLGLLSDKWQSQALLAAMKLNPFPYLGTCYLLCTLVNNGKAEAKDLGGQLCYRKI